MKRYLEMRQHFMQFEKVAPTESSRKFWGKRVAYCNRKIGRILARRIKKCVVAITILVLLSIILTSCNAVAGAGRDITWMGVAGQEMLEYGHEAVERNK